MFELIDMSTISDATLLQWNGQLVQSLQLLGSGKRVASANYAQGDGSRGVVFSATSQQDVLAWTAHIQSEMERRGLLAYRRRRAIGIRF